MSDSEGDEDVRVLWITDFTDAEVKRLARHIHDCEEEDLPCAPVAINSAGGYLVNLLAMADIIEASSIPVLTMCTGIAMSAGAVLLAAGTKGYRFVSKRSSVMVHEPSYGSPAQKHSDFTVDADEGKRQTAKYFSLLDQKAAKKAGYFSALLRKRGNGDYYMAPAEAVKHGLADYVGIPRFAKVTRTHILFEPPKKTRGK